MYILLLYPSFVCSYEPIVVDVNEGRQIIDGIKKGDEIYFPFSFIKPYYEAYSSEKNGVVYFKHNNAIFRDVAGYTPTGNYLNFDKIAVENWDNYFDGHSIPVNNFRWGQHYYPISILHYGISHHAQKLKCGHNCDIDSNYDNSVDKWINYSGQDNISANGEGVRFTGLDSSYMLKINSSEKYINLDLAFRNANYRVYFEVETTDGIKHIQLNAGSGSHSLNDKYYYVGVPLKTFENRRITIFRDLQTDVKKMFGATYKSLLSVKVRGDVDVFSVSTSKTNHTRIIKRVADWLLEKQDSLGAWPSEFDHMFYSGRTEVMKAGWYSAMAQGLAISHLVRAHSLLGDEGYLDSARSALQIYSVPVSSGGVLDYYDSRPVYEEYPTTPSSHVLNGFIFALLGLYDLQEYDSNIYARDLYEEGFNTLENILPLYDMGNRSAYDLTHISSKTYPNIARWSYHATHVHQLKVMMSISKSTVIKEFHDRWYEYAFGFKVKTN
ncbi:hypothetical protein C9I90_02845 [Photobacterium aphoticum]|uniref:D-glucuronyl C5-epimerase C-terminal domain-containing protein n=2 Tax=Photobacterium aphoticum TaxID=754436 RepID=A0A0J1JBR4_9GAMM|nr:hypothetical protein ABT58_19495 [Photobacterium aphoticum]PSU59913.1 hypothetical protein C9I90_02845 [Photobacterium aphoticum]